MNNSLSIDPINWKKYSLYLIIFFTIFTALNHFIFPISLDIYYHLGVAQEFNRGGGFTAINFSEFAPTGRAQLYPPLFQLLLALILKTGINPILLAKLLNIFIYPFSLLAFWMVLKKIYGEKQAFFAIFTLSIPYSLFVSTLDNIPATLSIIFILISWWMLENKRIKSTAVFLGLAILTHAAISFIAILAFLFYSLFKKDLLKKVTKSIALALAFASPYLLHLLRNIRLLEKGSQRDPLEISWVIFVLFTLSLINLIKHKKQDKYLFWIAYSCASLIMLLFYPYRFFSAQGMIPLIIIASISLKNLFDYFQRKTKKAFPHTLPIMLVFFFIINFTWPLLIINTENPHYPKKVEHLIGDSTLTRLSHALERPSFRLHDVTIYSRFSNEIAQIIKEDTEERQIFFCSFSIFGQLLSAISDRPNAEGMLNEVKPFYNINPFRVSRLFVAIKNSDGSKDTDLENRALSAGFKLLKETDIAFIYKNENGLLIRPENQAQVRFIFLFLFLLSLAGIVFVENIKST